MLPFAINKLPGRSRGHIRLVSLLGFAKKAEFEVGIAGWLGVESSDAEDTLAEIAKLPPIPLQCVYGDRRRRYRLYGARVKSRSKLRMNGGHHFNGDYKEVASAMLDAADAAR